MSNSFLVVFLLRWDREINYIRKSHVLFPLLATTGAARLDQRRRFSFGFYSIWTFVVLHFSIAENLQR